MVSDACAVEARFEGTFVPGPGARGIDDAATVIDSIQGPHHDSSGALT